MCLSVGQLAMREKIANNFFAVKSVTTSLDDHLMIRVVYNQVTSVKITQLVKSNLKPGHKWSDLKIGNCFFVSG